METQFMNPEVIYKFAVIGFDRDDRIATEGLNVQAYLEHLAKTDPVVKSVGL